MHVTKIDIERQPDIEEYEQTIRVWFDNGGSIRFVEDVYGRIIEQAFTPDDPQSVWDDVVVSSDDGESLEEFTMVTLSVMLEQLREEHQDSKILKAVTGNTSPTPTNVEYE